MVLPISQMNRSTWGLYGGLFGVLIVLKGLALALYGPVMTPDSAGYVAFADIILTRTDWLATENLAVQGYPETSFRIIGYPALIALAKLLSGESWPWLIVIVQMAVSLIASGYIAALAKRLTGGVWLAGFAGICHAFGQTYVLDQCILTDSLNASLLLILAAHVGCAVLDRRRPGLGESMVLGAFVLGAFLLREAGSFFQYLYWPLLAYWGLCSGLSVKRTALVVVLFALPMLLGTQAYKAWNEMRTGKAYITTAPQTGMYIPTLELARRGVPVVAEDPLLQGMEPFGPWASTTPLQNVSRITAHLMQRHGFDALDLARHGMARFKSYWLNYPLDMAAVTLSHVREKQAFLAFRPVESVSQLVFWATGRDPFPKKGAGRERLWQDGSYGGLVMVMGRSVSRIVSAALTLAFVLGAPILFVRAMLAHRGNFRAYEPGVVLMVLFWLMYFGYTIAYAMITLELRYLMPVEPLSMVVGVTVLASLANRYKQRRGA